MQVSILNNETVKHDNTIPSLKTSAMYKHYQGNGRNTCMSKMKKYSTVGTGLKTKNLFEKI